MSKKTIELDEIETITLAYYNQNASAFWSGTKDHDVAQNYEAFLSPFPQDKKRIPPVVRVNTNREAAC